MTKSEETATATVAAAETGTWSRKPGQIDELPLLRDVAFNRHSRNFSRGGANVASPGANGQNHVGVDGIKVRLIQGLPDERDVAKVIWKGRAATMGVDVSDAGDERMWAEIGDDPETWREMFKGGLQTAMEAFVLVFEVSGVSRTATHQIVRSRRAGFHQQSQRAGSYVRGVGEAALGADVRVPESVWRAMNAGEHRNNDELLHAWEAALYWSREAYRLACEADVSYQDARFILPEGTENYIICEYSLREFLAVYAYRACSMFQWEICHIVREMGRLLLEDSPWLRGTGGQPRISCELTSGGLAIQERDNPERARGGAHKHMCTFQGWEKVDGQCDFPWAHDYNRTFKPHKSI